MLPLIILAGPTTSRKSDTALALADKLGTEIINADSMQVYKYFDIGTAKPSAEMRRRIRHHLIDFLEPDETFNAYDFKILALEKIRKLISRKKIPVMVGGTGLYIKVLTENFDCAVHISENNQHKVREKLQQQGIEACYDELLQIDPQTAEKLMPTDSVRIERAMGVFLETGKKMSDLHAAENPVAHEFPILTFLLQWDRDELYENINRRVELMVASGLVDEVRNLLARGFSKGLKPFQSIGYAQIVRHLEGEISLERAVYEIQRDTRHYAKRQITWFKKTPDTHSIPACSSDSPATLAEMIMAHLPKAVSIVAAVILWMGSSLSTLAAQPTPFQEGVKWFQNSEHIKAENRLRSLDNSSKDALLKKRARFLLAHIHSASNRHQEAQDLFQQALKEYAEIEDYIRFAMARNYLGSKQEQAALGEIDTLLEKFPQTTLQAQAHLLRLEILERTNSQDLMLAHLKNLVEKISQGSGPKVLKPLLPDLMDKLVRLHKQLGHNGEAYQLLRTLYIFYPNHPAAENAALKIKHLASLPDVLPIPISLGDRKRRIIKLLRKARHRQVIEEIDAIENNQAHLPPELLFYRAQAYNGTRERDKANESLQTFLTQYPKHSRFQEALFTLGKNLWNMDEEKQALEKFSQVLRFNKASKWALKSQFVISRIHESEKQYPLALKNYEILIGRYTNAHYAQWSAWRIGWIHFSRHDYTKALARFKKNILTHPRSDLTKSNLFWAGKAAEKLSLTEQAKQIYQDLYQRFPFTFFGMQARDRLTELGIMPPLEHSKKSLIRPVAFKEGEPQRNPAGKRLTQPQVYHHARAMEMIELGFLNYAREEIRQLEKSARRDLPGVMWVSSLYNRSMSYPDSLRVLQGYKNYQPADKVKDLPLQFWEQYYPRVYAESIEANSIHSDIDPLFVKSLIRQESLYNTRALSPAGARGLMQIMPKTGKKLYSAGPTGDSFETELLYDPEVNIELGIKYLNLLSREVGNNPAYILASYNAGPHVLKIWLKRFAHIKDPHMFIEAIPYPETRNYVKKVLRNYGIYKALYKAQPSPGNR